MHTADFYLVLQWWVWFLVLSLASLPITTYLFRPFFDRGYIFSKTLALIFLSYLSLVLGAMHLLPFTVPSLILILIGMAVLNYVPLLLAHKQQNIPTLLTSYLKKQGFMLLFEEVLFLGGIMFLAHIRAFSPDIHGLEKYMDFGFMNSILRATYFPPQDMWLTPFSINYYYFGHFTGAVLTKLSQIPSHLTYNLILASVFSLSFVGSFSLGANLYQLIKPKLPAYSLKRIAAGLLTASLVTLSGNLHTLYAFFKPYENENPVQIWTLPFVPASFPNNYWYPNATRFIYNTIHEFPIYSWVVADLHGHVFDIPFVITTLAFLLAFLVTAHQPKKTQTDQKHSQKNLFQKIYRLHPIPLETIVILGLLLSVMYMTNAWDGLIYLLLSGLFFLYLHITVYAPKKITGITSLLKKDFLLPLVFSGIFLFFCFSLFSLPFSLHFKPFVSGIGVLCAPEQLVAKGTLGPFLFEAQHCQRSPWWQLLILYGFFYFFIFSFLIFLTRVKNIRLSDTFVLLLIILGTLLIIIPEFIYVKDIYPAHYRANTMFKLVFQSFILLSITASYSIVRITGSMRQRKLTLGEAIPSGIFLLITLSMLSVVFIYPFQAINAYYGNLQTYTGLDGTKYLDTLYASDYAGIQWLNAHVTGQPVILEAQGDSYTDFARVSANTGLPTVLGWTVHEWLWRNSYDVLNPPADPRVVYEVPAPRIAEIETLYQSPNLTETKRLLKKYKVHFVFLGALERQKYPTLDEKKWEQLGKRVFKNGGTMIYEIPS